MIKLVGSGVPTAPKDFLTRLGHLDHALICYWNPWRNRWVIDRCTRDDNQLHSHTPECPKTNVLLLQEDDGSFMELGDRVIEKLQSRDLWAKHGSWEKMTAAVEAEEAKQKEQIAKEQREDIQYCGKEGRVQLNKMHHLIQQHDMRVNK